jgi:magnesium-transporting ATPase (P-type)
LNVGEYYMGTVMACSAILVVNLTVAMDTHSWVWIHGIFYMFSCSVFFVYSLLLSFNSHTTTFGLWRELFPSPAYWLTVLLIVIICLTPRFLYLCIRRMFSPTERQIYQEIQSVQNKIDKEMLSWRQSFSELHAEASGGKFYSLKNKKKQNKGKKLNKK